MHKENYKAWKVNQINSQAEEADEEEEEDGRTEVVEEVVNITIKFSWTLTMISMDCI